MQQVEHGIFLLSVIAFGQIDGEWHLAPHYGAFHLLVAHFVTGALQHGDKAVVCIGSRTGDLRTGGVHAQRSVQTLAGECKEGFALHARSNGNVQRTSKNILLGTVSYEVAAPRPAAPLCWKRITYRLVVCIQQVNGRCGKNRGVAAGFGVVFTNLKGDRTFVVARILLAGLAHEETVDIISIAQQGDLHVTGGNGVLFYNTV